MSKEREYSPVVSETTFTNIEELPDCNVTVLGCVACDESFIWGEDDPPKFCPRCGRRNKNVE